MTPAAGELIMALLAGALVVSVMWVSWRTAWGWTRLTWACAARAYLNWALEHLEHRGLVNTPEYREVWWRHDYWHSRIRQWEQELDR